MSKMIRTGMACLLVGSLVIIYLIQPPTSKNNPSTPWKDPLATNPPEDAHNRVGNPLPNSGHSPSRTPSKAKRLAVQVPQLPQNPKSYPLRTKETHTKIASKGHLDANTFMHSASLEDLLASKSFKDVFGTKTLDKQIRSRLERLWEKSKNEYTAKSDKVRDMIDKAHMALKGSSFRSSLPRAYKGRYIYSESSTGSGPGIVYILDEDFPYIFGEMDARDGIPDLFKEMAIKMIARD